MKIQIALFEPDIPQNTGTILRMADCFGIHVHIIEPCGFIFGGAHMKRAGMDYLQSVQYTLHSNWSEFISTLSENNRIIIATTKTDVTYTNFSFENGDIILFGKESRGLPQYIHDDFADKITIKMQVGKRSLNLAVSCGIIVSEALRQLGGIV